MSINSGIVYPTIELTGVTYTLKFTRGGILYRLSRLGTDFTTADKPRAFASIVDGLHAAMMGQFPGSPEDLAQVLLDEGKVQQAADAVTAALKKVSPPAQIQLRETAGTEPEPKTVQ